MKIARCPACLTAFRVGEDVLGRRGGRVRCGHCYRPFDALEHLVAEAPQRPDESTLEFEIPERFGPPRTSPGIPPQPASATQPGTPPDEDAPSVPDDTPAPASTWKPVASEQAEARMRHPFGSGSATRRVEEDDRVEPSLDGEPDLPPPATASVAALDAIADADNETLEHWRAQAYAPETQPHRWAWALGVGILLGVLVVQASFIYRAQITREWPQLRPVYLQVCAQLGCEVPLPRALDQLDVVMTRLDRVSARPRSFVLVAEIANLADHPQQVPYLELSLQDRDDRPVTRRAFAPEEWLPAGTDPRAGIAAGERLDVALPFETAERATPAGYRVNLFYP